MRGRDEIATLAHGFRDLEMEAEVLKLPQAFGMQLIEIGSTVPTVDGGTAAADLVAAFDAFHRALEAAWGMLARVDKFISEAKPWEGADR